MGPAYKITLCLHILSGSLALFCGFISVISKKGGKTHRTSGKTFFYCMIGVCLSAVYISLIKNNSFLMMIGIFSFYLTYSGYRVLKNKSLKPHAGDLVILVIAAINSFFMVSSMNIILTVFGLLSVYTVLLQALTAIRIFRKQALEEHLWLKRHIGMMLGAFTSTLTAFLVVNSNYIYPVYFPVWAIWLLPTCILSPLSVYYARKYVANANRETRKKTLN